MDENTLRWVMEGPGWLRYRALLDLADCSEGDHEVRLARGEMLADKLVQELVLGLQPWPVRILNSHKSAGHPLHQLVFLADLGLRETDPGMKPIIDRILSHQDPVGPFQVLSNVPVHYGGTGQDSWGWALCDAPLLLYALVKFGMGEEAGVQASVKHLVSLARENGWPCAGSKEMGRWRGPGRKEDPCPYATLIMLQLLGQLPEWKETEQSRSGIETLLRLWEDSERLHPYMFYMGNDFRKLKAPLVWYDLLHVVDVLSQYAWVKEDGRFQGMLDLLKGRLDAEGKATGESVWLNWKEWEFGQKKEPSRWITLVAQRALMKVNRP